MKKQTKLEQEFWEKYGDNTNNAQGCSEPGYDDKPVILANWNNIPAKYFDHLESHGYSCEWEDEWIVCDECYKAFRCVSDSYAWEMYGYIGDGFAVCGDCIEWDEYLRGMENNPKKAVTCSLYYSHEQEIESRYTLVQDEFYSGFHQGMDDDPSKILAGLLEKDSTGKYLFVIDEQSQFYISFRIYKRNEETEETE